MINSNQYRIPKLENSKIIITSNLYERLMFLVGRSTWIPSEHMCLFYGKETEKNVFYFDEMNVAEDYISLGEGSKDLQDYHVSPGDGQMAMDLQERIKTPGDGIVLDVHTHPSDVSDDLNLKDEYRYFSWGDLETGLVMSEYSAKYGKKYIIALIGVDRVNGNMTISSVMINHIEKKVKLIEDIQVYNEYTKKSESLPKIGDIQLLYKNWGMDDVPLSKQVEESIKNLK